MPVSAGEVEAILTARDNMSQTIDLISQRVQDLRTRMLQLGASGDEVDKLKDKLYGTQVQLANMQMGYDNLGMKLAQVGQASQNTYTQMDALDRLATRMLERMAIFYTLRETFDFVKGLYEGAAALEHLNDQLDLSLGKLQELQYAGDQEDVPFKQITNAVDDFNKKLQELKPTTVDALSNLGFSLDQIFRMNPDQRFDAVVAAIAAMPSHLQRSKAEVQLFGTDAIDGLIKNLKNLETQARENNAVMGDETIHVLATATQAYKDFFATVKSSASTAFAGAIEAASGFFELILNQDPTKAKKMLASMLSSGGDISQMFRDLLAKPMGDVALPAEFSGKAPTPGSGSAPDPNAPLYGPAFVESIREASMATKDLTVQQEDEVRELMDLDAWNEDNAAKIGLTTVQYKELTKASEDRAKAQTQEEEGERKWRAEQAAALLEITKLNDQYNAIVDSGGTSFDAQVAAIDRWALDLEAKMQKAGTDTDEFYTALYNVWTAKLNAISLDTKKIQETNSTQSQAGLQQIADKAYNTYQYALTQVGHWSDSTIQSFKDTYTAAQKAADEWGSDNETWINKLVDDQTKLQNQINQTAAAQKAASGFFLTNAQLGFVNPFIPGSTGYLPGRAGGGPVTAGQAYTVNENTPNSEIFIPSVSGTISPSMGNMSPAGGGLSLQPTIIIQSLTPSDPRTLEVVRQAADRAIMTSLRNLVRMTRA